MLEDSVRQKGIGFNLLLNMNPKYKARMESWNKFNSQNESIG